MCKRVLSVVFGTTLISFSATSVIAQSSGVLEEVVVTARKRVESLQDVPVAVTAITADQLLRNNATDLSKLAELAPQVVIGEYGTGTGAVLTIRGISSAPVDAGLEQSVLVVVDGVPIANGGIIKTSLFDTRQVEVLQGPQALFFGKNSPAGVISLQTADPTDKFEGSAKIGYEFDAKERSIEGVVSGPLTDTLNARLAVRGSDMDGWIRNVAEPIADPLHPGVTAPGAIQGDTAPKGHNYAGRLTFVWTPSDSFDANLKLTVDQQELNGNTSYFETFCVDRAAVPTFLGIPEEGADCKKNKRISDSGNAEVFSVNFPFGNNGKPYADSKLFFGALTLHQQFEGFDLTSTTGYYDKSHVGTGTPFSPYAEFYSSDKTSYELITEELRANTDFDGPLNFMGGMYYEHARRGWFNAADLFHIGIDPDTNSYAVSQTKASTELDAYSAFVQVLWEITPQLELTAGARYSRDKRNNEQINIAVSPFSPLPLYPKDQLITIEADDDNVSPEVTLSWHPRQDQTLYAAYKTGYKAGGFSNPALLRDNATPENLTFGPEETDGFEVGYKGELLDRTLRFDVTAYTYNYDGLQVVAVNSQFFDFLIGNAAEARTQGISGSFEWLATDRLSFNGNAGYNEAEYQKYPGAQCYPGQTEAQGCIAGVQDLSGKPLQRAPDLTFTLGTNYTMQLGSGWEVDLSLDGSHSASYQSSSVYAPGAVQPDYWRLNAGVSVTTASRDFEFALIGRNLTDSYYLITADPKPLGGNDEFVGVFNRPREVVLQATYRF